MSREQVFYRLHDDGMTALPCSAQEAEIALAGNRVIARTAVEVWDATVRQPVIYQVSTVFLCVDHALWSDHPILWETMIFGATGPRSGDYGQWRERSWVRAVARHRLTVARLRRGSLPDRRRLSIGGVA